MIDINFISPTGGIVKSVNGKTGRVELTAKDVGAATPEDVANAVGAIEIPEVDFTGYATEEYVVKKIAEAELAESDVDLSAYYTKSETDKAIKTAVDAIEIPETDLTNYATKSYVTTQIEINQPDLSDYATEEYVGKKIAEAQLAESDVDLSDYYTKSETEGAIDEAIAAIDFPEPDLSEYAKKSEIPSTTGLATETYVNEQIGKIPATDLSNYYTKQQTNQAIQDNVPDMNLYATKTYVGNEIAKIYIPDTSKFLTEVPAEYITETELEEALAEIPTGGGSVAVDGVSIIQNEDGTISTSVGIYYADGAICRMDSVTTTYQMNNTRFVLKGMPSEFVIGNTYTLSFFLPDGSEVNLSAVCSNKDELNMGTMTNTAGESANVTVYLTGAVFITGYVFSGITLTNVAFGEPAIPDASKIPASAVPVDGVTIYIENGVLKAAIPASGEEVSY